MSPVTSLFQPYNRVFFCHQCGGACGARAPTSDLFEKFKQTLLFSQQCLDCALFFKKNVLSFYFWKGSFSILINLNAQVDAKEMTKRPQCPYCCCFVDLSEKQTRHFSFWQLPMSLIGQRVFFLLPLSPLPCPCSVSDLKVTGTDCVTASEGAEPLKPSDDWTPPPHPTPCRESDQL